MCLEKQDKGRYQVPRYYVIFSADSSGGHARPVAQEPLSKKGCNTGFGNVDENAWKIATLKAESCCMSRSLRSDRHNKQAD